MKKVINIALLHSTKKNQLAFLTTRKTMVAKKDMPEELQKLCRAHVVEREHSRIVRLKCDYLKIANEERAKQGLAPLLNAGPLPWGSWGILGVLIIHKDTQYLRCYPYRGELQETSTTYYIDNCEVPEVSADFSLIDDWQKSQHKNKPTCYSVKVDDITELSLLNKEGDPETDIIWNDIFAPDE